MIAVVAVVPEVMAIFLEAPITAGWRTKKRERKHA